MRPHKPLRLRKQRDVPVYVHDTVLPTLRRLERQLKPLAQIMGAGVSRTYRSLPEMRDFWNLVRDVSEQFRQCQEPPAEAPALVETAEDIFQWSPEAQALMKRDHRAD